ncbi:hypothetical protein AUI06_08165 [archaeon 13_2_20CM_2_52_21]|nr:MAG: hypothetical protein AUI06_08165 [archaeon 13_2_20CM_2_52_21]
MFKGCTPVYGKPEVEYDLNDPADRDKLGIADDGKFADGYCHFQNCTWMVEERKGAYHIKVAIEQLESTVRQLLASGRKVTMVVIRMKGPSRNELRRFTVDKKSRNVRLGNTAKEIRIPGVDSPVKVIYENDLQKNIEDLRGNNWVSALA